MSDLINRQSAIDICESYNGHGWVWEQIKRRIEELPDAQPTVSFPRHHENDCISRQAAIDAAKMGALSAATIYGRTDEGSTALYETVKAINALPSAQPEQRWIPVSEKQPLVSGEFFVTLTDKDGEWVSTAEWNTTFGGRWQDIFLDDGYRDISNVIAWMPLPEPYKEEGEADA